MARFRRCLVSAVIAFSAMMVCPRVGAQEFWDMPDRLTLDTATVKDHEAIAASCANVPRFGGDDQVGMLQRSKIYWSSTDCRRGRYVKQACRAFVVAPDSGECLGTFYVGESIQQILHRERIEEFLEKEQGETADLFRKALRRAKPEEGEVYYGEGIKGSVYVLDSKRGFYVFSMY